MTFSTNNLDGLGGEIRVPIPRDSDGYTGRECPNSDCLGYFKVKFGTGLKGSGLPCHCPYCGHVDPHDRFFTQQQLEYGHSVALRKIDDALRADLKSMEFDSGPSGPFGIRLTMTLQPGTPVPIKHYREKQLETQITCDACTLDYSVYGLFAFCPDCGVHNSLQILERNLDLTLRQLDLSETLTDQAFRQHIVEDALENCVSAFDGFGRESCRVRAQRASDPSAAANVSFQNLVKAADRIQGLFSVDWKSKMAAADWDAAVLSFNRRHLLSHKSGIIDQRYVLETNDPTAIVGRRIAINSNDVRGLVRITSALGQALLDALPSP